MKKNHKNGFSIFLAVMVTSILLLVAFSVSYLSSKELSFSGVNRESQYAIFAADSGIECALYWDSKEGSDPFATSTSHGPITCAGQSVGSGQNVAGTTTLASIGGGGNANPTSVLGFYVNAGATSGPCSIVTIYKYYDGPDLVTHIHSYGYNTCDQAAPQRVERGIEVRY